MNDISSGIFNMSWQFGGSIGPIFGGIMVKYFGFELACFILGI